MILLVGEKSALAAARLPSLPPGWEQHAEALASGADVADPGSIASAFVHADELAAAVRPDAALVIGGGDAALAIAIGLVKQHVPVAALDPDELTGRVADEVLDRGDSAGLARFLTGVVEREF